MSDETQKLDVQTTDGPLADPCPAGYEKYTDVEPFAEGGGAEIHLGTDSTLARKVIIKTLRAKFRDDERMRRRFLREARVTAIIQHPGVVPIYEMNRTPEGDVYFTMKKVEGYTLKQVVEGRVARSKEFDRYRNRNLLIDIVLRTGETVAAAHRAGVIHRDLKPENIRVGDYGEVVVMDWGVAKLIQVPDEEMEEVADAVELEDLTQHGKLFGTPRYMSPEQTWGAEDIDGRSDVFSLGVVLYELLSLRPLVVGGDSHTLVNKIRNDVFTPVRLREPLQMIPPALDAVCMKALRKQREDRYQSMDDFLDDLRRFQRGEPVEAQPRTPMERALAWRRRHPRITAGVEFGLLGALLGAILV